MANKKKKRGTRPPGQDPNEIRRQKLEARRQAKAEALAAQQRRAQREKWIRRGIAVVLLGAVVWFLFLRDRTPTEIAGNDIETFSIDGGGEHTTETVTYESSPPVSGAHAPQAPACGIYGEPIPNEQMVHLLEHGAIGLVYSPDADPAEIAELEEIAGQRDSHVFTMPYEGEMETPFAATAWGHLMRLDSVDADAVNEFYDEFAQQGGDAPEGFQECPSEENDPFEPRPTPSPTE